MGKKKNNKSNAQQQQAETEVETSQASIASMATSDATLPSPKVETQADDSQDLASQLAAAKAEIAALKQQLAEKDAEIATLRSERGTERAANLPAGTSPGELESIRERLKSLRKEQMEADAAKDAAWRQLKGVLGEISKLASNTHQAGALIPSA